MQNSNTSDLTNLNVTPFVKFTKLEIPKTQLKKIKGGIIIEEVVVG